MSNIMSHFENKSYWLDHKIYVHRGIMSETVDFDSFQRLRWDENLRPKSKWLSDEVVNSFGQVLNNREICKMSNLTYRRNHIYSSFFFDSLMDKGITNKFNYENVRRWTRSMCRGNAIIFDAGLLFFPINQDGEHWVMVVVDFIQKNLKYMDSFHGHGRNYYCPIIWKYLNEEFANVNKSRLAEGRETLDLTMLEDWDTSGGDGWTGIPRQWDSFSCGAFMLSYIECFIENIPIEHNEEEMQV